MSWMSWMGSMGLVVWLTLLGPGESSLCRVRVQGVPHAQLRHHTLVVGGRTYRAGAGVDVPRSAGAGVLRGPRYRGTVRFEDPCDDVVLEAEPLPAAISFGCLPVGAVVSCNDCPGWARGQSYLPNDVPSVQVDSWQRDVTFRIKARDYEPLKLQVGLHPGPNRFEPNMVTR